MSEWVMVPVDATEEMLDREYDPISSWGRMVDARPPIPRDVWNAMVERGAKESWNCLSDDWDTWDISVSGYTKDFMLYKWDMGLRAALGNPKVEGDEI